MIKRLLTLVLMVLALIGWAVPQEWSVDISRVQPYQFNAYHGETLEMKASFFLRGSPYDVAGDDFSLFWQTNGMGTVYWAAPAVAASNTVSAVFRGSMDPGAPVMYGFLGSTGSNYRASFAVRFAASPGAVPNELPLPVETIDFAKVAVLNAPWATKSEIDEGLAVAASSATNYTDSVAASLGALAWVDSVDWADILGKPSWIGATKPSYSWDEILSKPSWIGDTKPTYSLNDVCPDTENWLGRPGTTAAGKSIKVLAKTVNGVIEGGLTVTGSSNNDNNTTKYRYAGVTATRNGTATDYLFDTSSQSGIVRRSELASLAPGDYANVSNRAVHALGDTGNQTLSGGILTIEREAPDGDVWLQIMRGNQSGLALGLDGFTLYGKSYTMPLSSGRLALESQIPSGDEWSATNTVAVIARHTGKETVSIPSGGNLVADLSGWNDGVQTFVVLQPSGAYTVASNVEYCGYGTWPTNTALCVAWPYAGTLYVNPIVIIRE